jgi:hypothetical protein
VRRFMFRTVSQTSIAYRRSSLSEGRAGAIHGGDRLPWIADRDNFEPLRSLDWQVHVYGEATRKFKASCASRGVPLHEFEWSKPFARNASYLVRPDGYVALADPHQSSDTLEHYLDSRSLRS